MPLATAALNRKLTPIGVLLIILSGSVLIGLGVSVYRLYCHVRSISHLRASLPKLCDEAGRQRQVLVSAIESYKQTLGIYPPDHALAGMPPGVEPATNQLLYELLGSVYNPNDDAFYPSGFPRIRGTDARKYFNASRFRNSAESPQTVGHFLKKSDIGGTLEITDRPDSVSLLTFWPSWQGVDPEIYQQIDVGTWCYNSSTPAHKKGAYDLWIEIKTPLTNIIIANW
jgi:hypothetical protein